MSNHPEVTTLLKLPASLGENPVHIGDKIHIIKKGEKHYPLHQPLDFYDPNHKLLGKIIIKKLTLMKNCTNLYAEITNLHPNEV